MATPNEEALEREAREQAAVAEAYYAWEERDADDGYPEEAGLDAGGFPRLARATDAETGELWRSVDAALERVRGD